MAQPGRGILHRIDQAVGIPNVIAGVLSLALAAALFTRPHFRGEPMSALGSALIVSAVIFCFANVIRAGIEIARSGRSASDALSLFLFLFEGIFTRKQLTPAARNARNGLWVGGLALFAGVICVSLSNG